MEYLNNWPNGRYYNLSRECIMRIFIIVFLALLSVFLLLYNMGAFGFGSIIRNEHFNNFAKQRTRAVEQSPTWNIGVVNDETNAMGREVSEGINRAIKLINEQGGVKGKKIAVTFKNANDNYVKNKQYTQFFCDRMDTAYFIGAMASVQVKPTRTLTQFQALPGITPISLISPELDQLQPEIFSSLYEPFDVIMPPLIAFLKEKKYKNILLVSTQNIYDGGMLAMNLTDRLEKDSFFKDVFRINYSTPAQTTELYHSLKIFQENRNFDVIVFTDTPADLEVLGKVMQELKISIPVVGMDSLDITDLAKYTVNFPADLYIVKYSGSLLLPEYEKMWQEKFSEKPKVWEQYGIISCLIFKDAINDLEHYDPQALGAKIREMAKARLKSKEYVFDAKVVKFESTAGPKKD